MRIIVALGCLLLQGCFLASNGLLIATSSVANIIYTADTVRTWGEGEDSEWVCYDDDDNEVECDDETDDQILPDSPETGDSTQDPPGLRR